MAAAGPEFSAIVVCGGVSERFGAGDKALARLGGRRFLDRVVDAARALTDDIVLACGAAPRYAELGWPLALDHPDASPAAGVTARRPGPLAGLAAGLEAARGERVFLLAVDLPLVTPAALWTLSDALAGHEAVMPESEGRLHPLCALVRRAPARAAVARLLAAGPRAPRRLAEELRTLRLPVGPPAPGDALALALFNVNTDEDQVRAEEFLAAG